MVKYKANVKNDYELMFLGALECRKWNKRKFVIPYSQRPAPTQIYPIWHKIGGDARNSMINEKSEVKNVTILMQIKLTKKLL